MGHGTEPSGSALSADDALRIVHLAVHPFLLVASDGTVRWVSDTMEALTGHKPEALVGTHMLDWLGPRSRQIADDALSEMVREQAAGGFSSQYRGTGLFIELIAASGELLLVEVALSVPSDTGLDVYVVQVRPSNVLTNLMETLEAMAEERPLYELLAAVAAVVESSIADVIVEVAYGRRGDLDHITGASGAVSLARRAAAEPSALLHHSDDARSAPALPKWERDYWLSLLRDGGSARVSCDDLPDELAESAREMHRGGAWTQFANPPAEIDGSALLIVWFSESTSPHAMIRVGQTLERAARIMAFVLDWDDTHRSLTHAASHDPLTELANRRALFDYLRSDASTAGSLLYLDLDGFKAVNDNYGHRAGDEVLRIVSRRLRRAVRPGDVVARVGGDEFVIVYEGLTDPTRFDEVASRALSAVCSPMRVSDVAPSLSASIGMAPFGPGSDPEQVIDEADRRMRMAKTSGKARIVVDG